MKALYLAMLVTALLQSCACTPPSKEEKEEQEVLRERRSEMHFFGFRPGRN